MKCKRFKISAVILLELGLTGLQAQESINPSGGDASGSGGSASYSIGQVVYQTKTGAGGVMTEGVQQPFEISVVTALEETKGVNLTISAYPNPTAGFLSLEVKDMDFPALHFQLYDMQGKLLQSGKITGNPTSIAMSSLAPATYFLKIIQGDVEVKIFKILKN